MVRVRFAPSPTGYLHVGGLRTALYDYLLTRHEGGSFVLRIEDTDRTRYVEGAVESIVSSLEWAGIAPDEGPYLDESGEIRERGDFGPYVQSERSEIYREHVDRLIEGGHAYRCFCTAECLTEMRERQKAEGGRTMYDRRCRELSDEEVSRKLEEGVPYVVRLRVPDSGTTSWEDEIRGRVEFANSQIDDQVLLKSDGYPTYHLANVVDDHLMEISHVIRGEEWCSSTPKHLLLFAAFGWEPPKYAHMSLLLNPDRSKLSKRQAAVSVDDYREKGYLPEALINFVGLLGWNPSSDREIYSLPELADAFALKDINPGGAVFDLQKLEWMNGEYMKSMPAEELAVRAEPFYLSAGLLERDGEGLKVVSTGRRLDSGELARAVASEKERVRTLAELPEATAFMFGDGLEYEQNMIPWKKSTPEEAKERLEGLLEHLEGLDETTYADLPALESAVLGFVASKGWTNADSLWPLRVALTARKASPSPFEVAWVLGKERTLSRVRDAINAI